MANAKECDVCHGLYRSKDDSTAFHPDRKDDPAVYAVLIKFKNGNDDMDLCPACVLRYLDKMRDHISKNFHDSPAGWETNS